MKPLHLHRFTTVSPGHPESFPGSPRGIPQPIYFNNLPVSGKAGQTLHRSYHEHENH